MTMNEEIILAKDERNFRNDVIGLMNDLLENVNDVNDIHDSDILNIRNSEPAEALMEYDYSSGLANLIENQSINGFDAHRLSKITSVTFEELRESKSNLLKAIGELRESISNAKHSVEFNDLSGYKVLAEAYLFLEGMGTDTTKRIVKYVNERGKELKSYQIDRAVAEGQQIKVVYSDGTSEKYVAKRDKDRKNYATNAKGEKINL